MKILVRGTNWIGDAVMSIPALKRLRNAFPAAAITLHTRTWAEGIFRDADFIDEILPFDISGSKLRDALGQARLLREKKFDIAILLPNSFESALTARIANVPKRFGYASDGRSFLLTNAIKIPEWKNTRHEAFYYLNLINEVERDLLSEEISFDAPPSGDLPVSGERREKARELFIEHGIDPSKKMVAFGVGSTNSRAKRWPAACYAALNDRLQKELGVNIILVGGPDEIDVSNEVCDLSGQKPAILTGKTDLAEAVAVLAGVDMLISNDMGLAHIAPAVGTKTLVIFGPTNPETTRPFSDNAQILRRNDVECAPCMLRDCPIDHRCMTWISVDDVFDKVRQALLDE